MHTVNPVHWSATRRDMVSRFYFLPPAAKAVAATQKKCCREAGCKHPLYVCW